MNTSIKVLLNYELERLLLSYGDSVKVIAPSILSEKIQQRLTRSIAQY